MDKRNLKKNSVQTDIDHRTMQPLPTANGFIVFDFIPVKVVDGVVSTRRSDVDVLLH
jgi:hypothetical protein